jgi:preprotein translocase subunit SecG
MSTVETVLLALLVLDAITLTVLVLLQQGKGADVGAAFGSGSSNTVFGAGGGASFMTKATAWLAIVFFVIAFSLAYIAKEKAGTVGEAGMPLVQDSDDPGDSNSPVPILGDADSPPTGDVPVSEETEPTPSDDDIPDL